MQCRFDGKQKTYTIGVYPSVSFAEARTKRDEARAMIAAGVTPVKKTGCKGSGEWLFYVLSCSAFMAQKMSVAERWIPKHSKRI